MDIYTQYTLFGAYKSYKNIYIYIYLVLTKSSLSYAAVINTPKILVAHNKIGVFLTSHVHLESATIMLYLCRLDVG